MCIAFRGYVTANPTSPIASRPAPPSFRTKRPGFFLRTFFVHRVAQRGIALLFVASGSDLYAQVIPVWVEGFN